MHVLIARAPGGTTHAVSCETSAEFGARFVRTMEVQGCAVERLTLTEYAARRGLGTVPVPKGAPWAEEVSDVEGPAPVDEVPAPAEAECPTADLPALDLAVGDAVQASVIGAATVTHVLAYPDGTRLAVARSRVGEQLLRPGTYTRADLSAAAPAPTPPAPLPAPVDVPSPAPKPTVMPSLF
ncbi:hypothetical protein [Deinococcus sp. JMULE3]|uniref:hypothetical protein n=1 Tax=Deinococcus sp. JMULE3 TaxID=2518341 RepID=UPI001576954B|nr:hypothetical protein [Deinococcus sp. JMULE3]NTX99254.1 hypothetical protein [Deinococcus sp. JMULE3]